MRLNGLTTRMRSGCDEHVSCVCSVEAVSVYLYGEPQLPSALLDFFTTTRRGTAKGIIALTRV
jgi:hypothetical protein